MGAITSQRIQSLCSGRDLTITDATAPGLEKLKPEFRVNSPLAASGQPASFGLIAG